MTGPELYLFFSHVLQFFSGGRGEHKSFLALWVERTLLWKLLHVLWSHRCLGVSSCWWEMCVVTEHCRNDFPTHSPPLTSTGKFLTALPAGIFCANSGVISDRITKIWGNVRMLGCHILIRLSFWVQGMRLHFLGVPCRRQGQSRGLFITMHVAWRQILREGQDSRCLRGANRGSDSQFPALEEFRACPRKLRQSRIWACGLWGKWDMRILAKIRLPGYFHFLIPELWVKPFAQSRPHLSFVLWRALWEILVQWLKWSGKGEDSLCGSRDGSQSSGSSTGYFGGRGTVWQLNEKTGAEVPWGPRGTLRITCVAWKSVLILCSSLLRLSEFTHVHIASLHSFTLCWGQLSVWSTEWGVIHIEDSIELGPNEKIGNNLIIVWHISRLLTYSP